MKKQVNKDIIMSCAIFVILSGWCTNHGKYIPCSHLSHIHYYYGAHIVWCRCIIIKVHMNNHAAQRIIIFDNRNIVSNSLYNHDLISLLSNR